MFFEFTNTKICKNHNFNPHPFCGFLSSYDDFKTSFLLLLFVPTSLLKGFLLPPVPPGKPLHQAIHLMLPIQTNSPDLHQHTNKHLLNCIFSKSLTNI